MDVNPGAIDLNLLVVFDAIMRERNLTRAGNELGLSQSAMSHALSRLRHILKDELFVRGPGGMVPTPRAQGLAFPVREALNVLQRSFETPSFDPPHEERTFRIATDNYAGIVLVGRFAAHIANVAPKVLLEIYPIGTRDIPAQLDRGEFDLAIGSFASHADRFSHGLLMHDRFIAVMREDHPCLEAPMTLEVLAGLPHLDFTSVRYPMDFVDEALAQVNLTRRIALRAPLLSFVNVLRDSDMVAILPYRIAHTIVRGRQLAIHALPFTTPSIELDMMWPKWLDDHPPHLWLRENLMRVATDIARANEADQSLDRIAS